jgi:hypothetical protein
MSGSTIAQAPEHDPEKRVAVFPRDKREAFARRSCSNKKIERDADSKKSYPALMGAAPPKKVAGMIVHRIVDDAFRPGAARPYGSLLPRPEFSSFGLQSMVVEGGIVDYD